MKSKLVDIILQTENSNHGLKDLWTRGETKGGRIYSFLNPVSYLDALKHKELFCQMDGLFADGALLVAAIRLLYGIKVTRRSFDLTSLASKMLNYVVENRNTVYIVGSKQVQVERAVKNIREQYSGINIIGYRNGYFPNDEEKDYEARHIVELNPDFLVVGMKTVMQEQFLLKVKEAGYKGIGITCGGFLSQAAKYGLDYYPSWMDRMNLRFVYRMWKEPHTRKRYLKAGLVFPLLFAWERVFGFTE